MRLVPAGEETWEETADDPLETCTPFLVFGADAGDRASAEKEIWKILQEAENPGSWEKDNANDWEKNESWDQKEEKKESWTEKEAWDKKEKKDSFAAWDKKESWDNKDS